jgi:hypothetical protein
MPSITIDYLDGLSSSAAIKGPCRVAASSNVTLAGEQTIDAVVLADGDRVLVRGQTDSAENGIYVVSTGDWRRASDFSRNDDIVVGTMVLVVADWALYAVSYSGALSIGTTDLTFIERPPESGPVNLLTYGAVGSGLVDDSEAIQAALLGGNVHLYIPAGEYRCDNYIRLYGNTLIEMHPDAVLKHNVSDEEFLFLNGEAGNATFSSGYDGPGNITIRGGTIDLALKVSANVAIALMHGDTIVLEDVTFLNGYQGHFVEVNACRNVTIRRCLFDTMTITAAGSREMINIDYSYLGGFPHFGSYDGTVCDNVLIENCAFRGGDCGVGSHAVDATRHSSIRVINCHVEDMETGGIICRAWDKSVVRGNTIIDAAVVGLRGWDLTRSVIAENTVIGGCSSQGITLSIATLTVGDVVIRDNFVEDIDGIGIRATDATNVKIGHNTIRNVGSHGIQADSDNCQIFGNTIRGANQLNAGWMGITVPAGGSNLIIRDNDVSNAGYATNYPYAVEIASTVSDVVLTTTGLIAGSSGVTTIAVGAVRVQQNGAYRVSLLDDTAVALPVPASLQGLVRIACLSNVSPSPRGLYWVRSNAASVQLVAALADANVNLTTGVLAGTTGADTKVTLSADGVSFYIENRAGSTKNFDVEFMSGSI